MKKHRNGTNMIGERASDAAHNRQMSRRNFLKISGGSAAVAAGGMLYYMLHDPVAGQPASATTQPASANQVVRSTVATSFVYSAEEAAYFRHLRHRRQHRDGVYDVTFDTWEECDHNCIGALYAHELG